MTAGGDDRGARADDTCARDGCSHLRREHWNEWVSIPGGIGWGPGTCSCCDCPAWIPEPNPEDRLVPDPPSPALDALRWISGEGQRECEWDALDEDGVAHTCAEIFPDDPEEWCPVCIASCALFAELARLAALEAPASQGCP